MKLTRFAAGASIGLLLLMLATVVFIPNGRVNAQTAANWVGQFYPNPDFQGSPALATFPQGLNVNWGTLPPTDGSGNTIPGIPNENYSARFVATVQFSAGFYEFVATFDDGVRIYIDGLLVLDRFNNTGLSTATQLLNLPGGVNTIIVEYVNRSGPGLLQVGWFTSSGTPLPSPTIIPIATGSVQYVRGLSVRTGPYLGASMVAVAVPDKEYPILARNNSEGLFTWYKIQYDEDTIGWSSGRYLGISGNIDAIPWENTIFDQIDNAPSRGVVGVTRAVMNFRIRPSVRTQEIGNIPWGAPVDIIGRSIQGGRPHWYHVRYDGKVGWIYAPFVNVTQGIIDAVPVR